MPFSCEREAYPSNFSPFSKCGASCERSQSLRLQNILIATKYIKTKGCTAFPPLSCNILENSHLTTHLVKFSQRKPQRYTDYTKWPIFSKPKNLSDPPASMNRYSPARRQPHFEIANADRSIFEPNIRNIYHLHCKYLRQSKIA